MPTTNFIDKETVIQAAWLNEVDATIYQALNAATSPGTARAALDVPQETLEVVPQVRVNGAWQALSASAPALHAASHASGAADELDHDSLLNGLGSKHVDHSAVTVTGSGALQGGGDLTANRDITFTYVLEQDLSMGTHRITNLVDPATNQDAATKVYVDTRVIEAGGTPWVPGVTPNSIYYDLGFVGIGTDTPIYDLDVRGTGQFTGDVVMGSTLGVTGAATLGSVVCQGAMDAAGNTTLTTLTASGAVTLQNTLGVTGNTSLATLTASGAVTCQSTLGVAGNTSLSTVSVSGAATLPTITGPTILNGDLTLQ